MIKVHSVVNSKTEANNFGSRRHAIKATVGVTSWVSIWTGTRSSIGAKLGASVGVAVSLGSPTKTLAASPERLKWPNTVGRLSQEQIAAHLLNRLGFGPRPTDIAAVAANPMSWVQTQLQQNSPPLPESLAARLDESSFLKRHPNLLVQEFRSVQRAQAEMRSNTGSNIGNNNAAAIASNAVEPQANTGLLAASPPLPPNQSAIGRFVISIARPAIESRLLRALESPRQLEEVMVDFWFNHFNVFQGKNILRVLMGHYEHYAIRPFALGRFRDLLGATARHPAMLYYLDNAFSVAPGTGGSNRVPGGASRGLNENYARELMELHTMGVDGGYRQKDVTELARMLTGWSILPTNRLGSDETQALPGNIQKMPGFWFNERAHDQGHKEWLGYRVPAQGQAEGEFALDVLAKHPSTAKHIAFKLAQYFVSDAPSPALVNKLAQVFLEHDGEIVPMLTVLFSDEAFWAKESLGVKFKTPYQFVLSSVRALGGNVSNLQEISGALASQGMPLYGCPTPDGYKNTEAAWLNPDAITKRINFVTSLASRRIGMSVSNESLISQLGPLVSEQTKALAREIARDSTRDPGLANALVLAGPLMMRR